MLTVSNASISYVKPRALWVFAIVSFLDKTHYCEGHCVNLATFTFGRYAEDNRWFSGPIVVKLDYFTPVYFNNVFMLCSGYFSFSSLESLRQGFFIVF